MTYEKFEHKVIGMLLEGNDPKLERLLTQAWDREVISRIDEAAGFTVEFLAPSPLALDEPEGRVFGVEVELSDQPILHLELMIKDGLINQLNGTYLIETNYSEIISRYNELTFIYTNQNSSVTDFPSDYHDPNEVTFVKNIATISKEIDANISNLPIDRDEKETYSASAHSDEKETYTASVDIDEEETHTASVDSDDEEIYPTSIDIDEKETYPASTEELSDPQVADIDTQQEEIHEEASKFEEPTPELDVKKPSRLALRVEELKRAALKSTEEADSITSIEQPILPVILPEESVEVVEVEYEPVDDTPTLSTVQSQELDEKELDEIISEIKTEQDEEDNSTDSYIERLEQGFAKKYEDEEPEAEAPVLESETPILPVEPEKPKSYIEELEEAILRKLEAEDPNFIRRPDLITEDPKPKPESTDQDEPTTVIEESLTAVEVEEVSPELEISMPVKDEIITKPIEENITPMVENEEIITEHLVKILEDSVEKSVSIIEEETEKLDVDEVENVKSLRPTKETPVDTKQDQTPSKRMSLEEYIKKEAKPSDIVKPSDTPKEDVVMQQMVQSMVQDLDTEVIQSVTEKEKLSIGTKVGIFLIILGIIVMIAFIMTTRQLL